MTTGQRLCYEFSFDQGQLCTTAAICNGWGKYKTKVLYSLLRFVTVDNDVFKTATANSQSLGAIFTDMEAELIYVELKTGFNDSGPAWIGNGFYNRTRKTVYFNGQVFHRSKGISGNHIDLQSRDEYWISGVKKNGTDRHWAGSGTIKIDKSVIDDYLELRGLTTLTKGKYEIVVLDNEPAKEISKELENIKSKDGFDDSLKFKELSDLTDTEINELIDYYENLDLSLIHKKARKEYIDKVNQLKELRDS